MSDLTLSAKPALGNYSKNLGGVLLEERPDIALVSIATPQGSEDALAEAMRSQFGTALPAPSETTRSEDGAIRFLGMAPDQVFAAFDHEGARPLDKLAGALGSTAYLTDQSDVWVALRMEGSAARDALARICPLDLHPQVFPEGRVARTVMEHLGAIILREGPDTFLLLSARSSARSFLHAVETSIRNVT